MKIKVKKEMTLPRLIEWAWDNDVRSRMFIGSGDGIVKFDIGGMVTNLEYVDSDETFRVEVEEEITKDTVIPTLIEVYKNGLGNLSAEVYKNKTIRHIIEIDAFRVDIKAFYILNDDMTMTLIWKDGEMVE
ncbi:hypothetical protein KM149_07035 [Staphylococcus coagulans]|uniref:hypothetical protein n=1 Tax=Staphylococcus coagulans TaxID=74706 RepID=UPI001F4C3761|nr:hypothetical protein [Staphylococcus coagulans]UNB47649.1 hypothetical protein KM149_07035 [Staphylococcus coagulans]